jgi:hypothetical protein
MVKVDGRVEKVPNQTNMKAIIAMIKNMALVYSHGLVETYTKANIKRTKEMVMEK